MFLRLIASGSVSLRYVLRTSEMAIQHRCKGFEFSGTIMAGVYDHKE